MGQKLPLIRQLPEIARGRERKAVKQAHLRITSLLREMHGTDSIGALVADAVMVAHLEGRPLTATKIAHWIEVPRVTVLRRLKQLQENGVILRVRDGCAGDRVRPIVFIMNPEHANSSDVVRRFIPRMIATYHLGLKDIEGASNMDTTFDTVPVLDTSALPPF